MVIKKRFFLCHTFDNISKLTEERVFSKEEEFYGIPWKIGICKKDEYFSFYLYCMPENTEKNWRVDADRSLKIVSVTGKTLSRDTCIITLLESSPKPAIYGFARFIEWEKLFKDYVTDDKIIVEIRVKIKEIFGIKKKKLRNFDGETKAYSDVVLIVENEKFYTSKWFLACQSKYFQTLLLGKFKESGTAEINLEEINASDFQNFLEVLYGEPAIDDETVTGIIQLADMYDTPTVIRQCEEFLIEKSEKSIKEKLELAAKYDMRKLKNKCFIEVKTIDDVRSALSGDPSKMDSTILAALLRKAVEKE
ncbi:unnamed protein product [Caenorhabditis nigoni]